MALRAPAPPAGLRPGPPPRVSVHVPAYQAAATLGEALESALSQVPAPYELVVSDDGSTDALDDVLAGFGDRVRVVRGDNAGLATARNRAAAAARGDLLALLDADDVWLPGRVRALSAGATTRPDLAVLTTDAVVVRDGVPDAQTCYATRDVPVEGQDVAILRSSFVFGAGAVRADVFRAVGGYREGARAAEDWDLWLRLLLGGHRAGLVPEPLDEYRRRDDSLTGRRLDLARGVLETLERARPLLTRQVQRMTLQRTEQQWRETAARTAGRLADPRARRLAVRAAAGRAGSLRARLRFGVAAALPAAVAGRDGRA